MTKMIEFTTAEKNLINVFKGKDRVATICALQNTLTEVRDEQLASLIKTVLSKLLRIDGIMFAELCAQC